jgi:hypothetical protein
MMTYAELEEYFNTFDIDFIIFTGFLWAMLNIFNGFIIFNHEVVGSVEGEGYYIIVGTVRVVIGILTAVMFLYIRHHRKLIQKAITG